MAVEANVLLLEGQRRSRGDAYLLDDEIDAGDHLGDRVLDLEAGVHLDEVELAALVEELDGTHPAIAQFAYGACHGLADARPLAVVERRRQRLFPQLLMPPLQRAVALAEMDGIAPAVAKHLDLDVAGMHEILLEIDRVVAEGSLRLDSGRGERRIELLLDMGDLHAASSAAGSSLDQDWIADVGRDLLHLIKTGHGALRAGNDRQAEFLRGLLGLDLVAHEPDMLGARSDECDLMLFEDLGEAGILGEKAIARMHGVCARDLAGRHDLRNVEIAVLCRRTADTHALIGKANMHRVGVSG